MEIPFLPTEVLFAASWLLLRMAVWFRQKQIDWKREAVLLLLYGNLAVMLRFVLFPVYRAGGRVRPLLFEPAAILPFRVNLIPLVNLLNYRSRRELLLNLVGNVSVFIPSGIVLPIVYRRLNSFGKVTAAGALLSLGIEILQLPFSVRSTDVDDLILNTCGTMIGYGIYAGIRRTRAKRAARARNE